MNTTPPDPKTSCTPEHRLCTDGEYCEASDGERMCTRPPGHNGPHVACDFIKHNLAVWGKPPAPATTPPDRPCYALAATLIQFNTWGGFATRTASGYRWADNLESAIGSFTQAIMQQPEYQGFSLSGVSGIEIKPPC